MPTFLNLSEREDVNKAVGIGMKWDFGNIIDRLHIAWALKMLIENPDWDAEMAMTHAQIKDKERIKRCSKIDRLELMKQFTKYIGE